MTGKEILLNSLNHNDGPVPLDFGATSVTGLHCSVVEGLREYYGMKKMPVKIHEPYQMLGLVEEDLQEVIGADVTGVFPRNTMFGFPNENWKEWKTPWGQDVLVPGDYRVSMEGKDVYIYPEGDTSVPPSGRMPESGYFYDTIVRQGEIDDDNLNPEDNLEEFGPVKEEDLAYFKSACDEAEKTGRGIIATFGGTAFGDIAMVPGPFLKYPKGIRDVTEWYVSTMIRADYIHEVFEKQSEIALANLEKIFAAVGNAPDAVFICGTDFGTQNSQFCSVDSYEEMYAPYYRKINNWIHENTSWKTFKHSCGAVEPFMSHFIDSGFDIINPVQCSADGMDPQQLKDNYGNSLTFWGGGVDTQKTLPFGTPAEVRKEVRERLEIFSRQGGFVFDAIHNVQALTPVENMAALIETVKEFNAERS
ncbi:MULTISPECIES: uroporphyrinogen decarboxylase family protein [unclassified Oceanispirochaeta]|uniref:uroporphyrinogen decarboxylase family protein n=1 Tax=unclassified Oceanispirochaeta TaxID=2635722 RepID=UPI000E095507|nr:MULTISPECIES: uroporphyrinogen decarboxylase family protein [unclassified Oceanispirochaeta]MBF9016276.1 methyltransferase [Oceanispirochaeta sp. M2]NPD72739.1 methyltransferase [Oceanispirochaeta sp. M1]RDG31585.1 methyltransferase [Oceanispirochaeta sp. M1]